MQVMQFPYIYAVDNFRKYLQGNGALTDSQFDELSGLVSERQVPKNGVLLRPGEVCHFSFFVEHGVLRSYTIDEQGKEHIIQFASETWIVSDRSSAYFDQPSDYFIDAIEASNVVCFDAAFIDKAAQVSPR